MTRTRRCYNADVDSTFYHPYRQFRDVHAGICGRRCRHCRNQLLSKVYRRRELQAEVPTLAVIFGDA